MWVASGNPVAFLVDEQVQEVDKVSHQVTTVCRLANLKQVFVDEEYHRKPRAISV